MDLMFVLLFSFPFSIPFTFQDGYEWKVYQVEKVVEGHWSILKVISFYSNMERVSFFLLTIFPCLSQINNLLKVSIFQCLLQLNSCVYPRRKLWRESGYTSPGFSWRRTSERIIGWQCQKVRQHEFSFLHICLKMHTIFSGFYVNLLQVASKRMGSSEKTTHFFCWDLPLSEMINALYVKVYLCFTIFTCLFELINLLRFFSDR